MRRCATLCDVARRCVALCVVVWRCVALCVVVWRCATLGPRGMATLRCVALRVPKGNFIIATLRCAVDAFHVVLRCVVGP